MSKLPLVSVLIPMYNAEKTIESALESIQKQSYPNLEIICVDDGSDDSTLSIVERRAELDRRIKPHSHKHRGIVYSRNRLIELSKGEYLAKMDADDISRLDRIEKQVRYMESNPDIIASGAAMGLFNEKGTLGVIARPANHEVLLFRQLRGVPILNPVSIIRRSALLSSNIRYIEKYAYAEDYRLFFDLSRVGKLGNLPDVLGYHRQHPNQISVKYRKQQEKNAVEIRADIYRFLCKKYGLNPASDKPKEWRHKIPRHHDAIWPFLWYTVTHNTDLARLRKLRLVLFTHLRLTAKPRLIFFIFFKKHQLKL